MCAGGVGLYCNCMIFFTMLVILLAHSIFFVIKGLTNLTMGFREGLIWVVGLAVQCRSTRIRFIG